MSKEKRIRTLKAWVEDYENTRLYEREIELREDIADSIIQNRSRLKGILGNKQKNSETLQKKE